LYLTLTFLILADNNLYFVVTIGHYDGGLVSILDLDAVVSEKDAKEKAQNAG
jgi:purine-binding chemotaxis protein CheW